MESTIGKAKFEKSISPSKLKEQPPAIVKIKDKMCIPSFLQGFQYLSLEDLDILATYEEEQARR